MEISLVGRSSQFLYDGTDYPKKAIVQELKSIGARGTVLVYNITFEKQVTEDFAEMFPNATWLHSIVERLKELLIPF